LNHLSLAPRSLVPAPTPPYPGRRRPERLPSGPHALSLWTLLALVLLLVGCSAEPAETQVNATIVSGTPAIPATPAPAGAAPTAASGPAAAVDLESRDGMYNAPPEMTIDPARFYYATIRTEKGDIKAQLFADRAPITVNNFVYLARQGFYDGTSFHRVLDGFMAQAGDPTGSGAGGPGYTFADEFYPGLVFDQSGLLAMANRGPDTNGSQFFITFAPTDWLNGLHTIFGKVIEGEEVLAQITRREPGADAPGDIIFGVDIEESDVSILPTPTPSPPTPTPTPTPTPYAPSSLDNADRPLAAIAAENRVGYFNTAPDMLIDTGKEYEATIATSQGDLVVELFDDEAPTAVNNFVVLSDLGFYDDTPINLVRPDDSIIFGSPDNNSINDAGYMLEVEFNRDIQPKYGVLTYVPMQQLPDGTVLNSSSQILVALLDPPAEFVGQLGFFGQIVEGMDVLPLLTTDDRIESISITVTE